MTQPGFAPVREGDLLAGKYRVERVLGVGGMGVVVAARHEQLDQLVAIKFVREDALGSAGAVQRFLREARAAVKLRSDHAAKVLDVGTLESGAPYMVMELLEGSDLAQALGTSGPMPYDAAADWILQACEAVAEAHGAGIVHRDLKPQNLFLARTAGGGHKVKVLDFGVSKSADSVAAGAGNLTRTQSLLGSPLYMAPEQMRSSRDVDARADVWALGVVLFELLTTRLPFEAESMPELCLKVVEQPPQSLAALRPDLPPGLVSTVEKCLAKRLEERFANAAELAEALEPFAPPTSRGLADRARFALRYSSTDRGGAPSAMPASRAASAANPVYPGDTPSRLAPVPTTPSPWGNTPAPHGEGAPRPTPYRAAAWMAGGLLLVLAIVGVATLGRRPAPPASTTASLPAAVEAPPAAPSPRAEPSPAAAAAVTLAPPRETAPLGSSSASATTATPSASAAPVPPARPAPASSGSRVATSPPAAPRPAPARPATPDDDIPGLR
jgi:serine/threonine-protein kinase